MAQDGFVDLAFGQAMAAGDGGDGGIADLISIRGAVAAVGGTLDAGPRGKRGYRVEAHLPIEPDW